MIFILKIIMDVGSLGNKRTTATVGVNPLNTHVSGVNVY